MRTREHNNRYILEFGSSVKADGKVAAFVRVAMIDVGAQAPIKLPKTVVDHVTITAKLDAPPPAKGR